MSDILKPFFIFLKKILKNYYTYVIFLLLVSTYFTLTPFLKNTFQTPPNRIYLGAENDFNTYFKYLKTTLDGQNLSFNDFKTKLSAISLDEKYYLVNGRIDAVFAMSQFSSYHLSRLFFNFLFSIFSYLIISHIFKSRLTRLVIFSLFFLALLPAIINFFSYPHIAFTRLLLIIFIFILLKLLKLPKMPNKLNILPAALLVIIFCTIGFIINTRAVSSLKIDLKKDPALSALIYPSKDFYEGIGYLRDNADLNEKVICLKRCSVIAEVFAGTSPVPGTQEDIAHEMSTIFDNKEAQKKYQKENAVYWFIGPEEKPLIGPDFFRLKPKEVFKNKEVTIYRLAP